MHARCAWVLVAASVLSAAAVRASGATMGTSSYLQANVGWVPFNQYNTSSPASTSFAGYVNNVYYSSCPSGTSVEGCFQTVFGQLQAQGVTGVRIFVPLCDALPTCGSTATWNPGTGAGQSQAQQMWITNFGHLFADLANAQIHYAVITITAEGPDLEVPANLTWSPAYPVYPANNCSMCTGCGPNHNLACCASDVGTNVVFDPILPYGASDGTASRCSSGTGTLGYPLGDYWVTQANNGYNLAPANNQNFIGWTNYLNVINAVLAKARGVVNVYGFEIAEGLQTDVFTAEARFVYDNSSPGTAPSQYVQTVNGVSYANVIGALRSVMSSNGFDPGRVFYSAPWWDAPSATENCTNAYDDYARATHLDAITEVVNGSSFGMPDGQQAGTYGIPCGGTIDSTMVTSPIYSSQPDIVDVHVYPQVSGVANTDTEIQQVAAIDYGDIPHFLYEAGLTSAAIVIGETWEGTVNPLLLSANNYCDSFASWQLPSGAPSDNVAGFNNESVSNPVPLTDFTVTFRPWMNLEWSQGACFGYGTGPGTSGNYQAINYQGKGPYTPTNP